MGSKKKAKRLLSSKADAEAREASDGASAKAAHEIDEIFSRGKTKRKPEDAAEAEAEEEEGEQHEASLKKKKMRKSSKKQKTAAPANEEGIAVTVAKGPLSSKSRRKTSEGFSIFSEAELGWNRKDAGGTPLCPFDCNCCF